jgi:hypothetical protein
VARSCRIHNEERHNVYTSPNIIRMIKSRRIRLVEHVVCLGGGGGGERER